MKTICLRIGGMDLLLLMAVAIDMSMEKVAIWGRSAQSSRKPEGHRGRITFGQISSHIAHILVFCHSLRMLAIVLDLEGSYGSVDVEKDVRI